MACATYVEEPVRQGVSDAGSSGSGAAGGGSGSGGSSPVQTAGSAGSGGVAAGGKAGETNGGVASGGAGAGSGGMAGASQAGAGGASGGSGGVAGSGGMGGAGGTLGGAGTGGKASGGGGSGGAPPTQTCAKNPITAKSKWVVTASNNESPASPAQAIDDKLDTRWTTGKEQMGGEWLQLDLGGTVTLTKLTLVLGSSVNDYPRKYATRFSNSSMNMAAPVLVSGMGAASTDTVMNFPAGSTGRYVLISQSGVAPALWWSVAEIQVQCVD